MKRHTGSILVSLAVSLCVAASTAVMAQDRRAIAEKAIADAQKLQEQKSADASRSAVQKYDEAVVVWRELGEKKKEAEALNEIGTIYQAFGDAAKSRENHESALVIARNLGDEELEASTLLFLGQAYDIIGETRRELDLYYQALTIARKIKNQKIELDALGSTGYTYYHLGDLQKALNAYNQALPVYRSLGDKDGEAILLVNVGAIYSELGDPQSAVDRFLLALPIMRHLNNTRSEAIILNNIGTAFVDLEQYQKGIDHYTQSLELRRKTGDRVGESVTLANIGGAYLSLNDPDKARDFALQALAIQQELKVRGREATTLNNLGRISLAQHDYQKSLDYYSQALPIFREVGNILGESNTLHSIAFVERERGNLNESRDYIDKAIEIVESVRATLASQEMRESFFSLSQDLYKFRIDLLMSFNARQTGQGFDALALQTAEQSRSRSLIDLLAEARADIRQGVDPALLTRENDLRKKLNGKETERRGAKTPQQGASIEKEIETLAALYRDLQAEIRLKSPRYSALTQPKTLGIRAMQAMLDPDTLLLEYSLGKEASFLWIVSDTSVKSIVLPKASEIEMTARIVHSSISDPDKDQAARLATARLSEILVKPAASDLGKKRLVIVADGVLQYVPFAALTDGSGQPLIVDHEIDYLPSASTLASLRDERADGQPEPKGVAVFADPVFDSGDTRIKRAVMDDPDKALNASLDKARRDAGFGNTFPRLPGTRREAAAILSLVPASEGKRAIDFDASRATITSLEISKYRVIHFATHGILNSIHPELSGVVLSLVDENGKPRDGFLRLNDIYNLKLPADLVVLSACQTALGKDIKGEGLVGLTRGFMYAGSRRIVASLWSVEDQSTAELMKNFYKGMFGDKKLRPAAALREAQVTMLKSKQYSAPYYWSAFTIQGDWK